MECGTLFLCICKERRKIKTSMWLLNPLLLNTFLTSVPLSYPLRASINDQYTKGILVISHRMEQGHWPEIG